MEATKYEQRGNRRMSRSLVALHTYHFELALALLGSDAKQYPFAAAKNKFSRLGWWLVATQTSRSRQLSRNTLYPR